MRHTRIPVGTYMRMLYFLWPLFFSHTPDVYKYMCVYTHRKLQTGVHSSSDDNTHTHTKRLSSKFEDYSQVLHLESLRYAERLRVGCVHPKCLVSCHKHTTFIVVDIPANHLPTPNLRSPPFSFARVHPCTAWHTKKIAPPMRVPE